jgi:hypothetical protein
LASTGRCTGRWTAARAGSRSRGADDASVRTRGLRARLPTVDAGDGVVHARPQRSWSQGVADGRARPDSLAAGPRGAAAASRAEFAAADGAAARAGGGRRAADIARLARRARRRRRPARRRRPRRQGACGAAVHAPGPLGARRRGRGMRGARSAIGNWRCASCVATRS